MELKLLQSKKALYPMDSTDSEIVTVSKLLQPKKA